MKMMCWNSRGSSRPGFQAQTLYASFFALDVMCVVDTRTDEDLGNKLISSLPFDSWLDVPAQGQCGGLCLFWKSRFINVKVISSHERFIHCEMVDLNSFDRWFTTFVYAYPQKRLQLGLWNELANCLLTNDPWLLMGDFNSIMCPSEKLGGIATTNRYMIDFCNFLNDKRIFAPSLVLEFLLPGPIIIRTTLLFMKSWIELVLIQDGC